RCRITVSAACLTRPLAFFLASSPPHAVPAPSLHAALPISADRPGRAPVAAVRGQRRGARLGWRGGGRRPRGAGQPQPAVHRRALDRKSTRLNSSHVKNSYAVFCFEKKKGPT